jgi:type II secretory pathway component PulF
VTRESAQQLPSSDDASPAVEAGEPADTPTWDSDEGANGAGPSSAMPEGRVSREDEGPEPQVALAIRKEPWRLSHLMLLIIAIAIGCWMWVTLGYLLIVVALLAGIVMLITAGFVVARLRTTQQDALLSILAIAAERGMPLAPALSAFADQFRGRSHRRVMNVVSRFNTGTPLPEVLEKPCRIIARDATLMARVGHETGLLPRALRLTGAARAAQVAAWSAIASRAAYLLAVILIAEGILGYLAYRGTAAHFVAIFKDFNIRLPEVSRQTFWLVDWAASSPIASIIVFIEVICFLYIPFSFGGWMNYHAPVFDRLLPRRHAALVLRALSLVIEANRPIASGLETLAVHYPARWIRRRLTNAYRDVRLGADWIDALWRTGVIRKADAEVLASAASVGNLAWACRELADTAERRQRLRIQVLTQALFPVAVIVVGLAVAFVALGFFLPIVTLIQSLVD